MSDERAHNVVGKKTGVHKNGNEQRPFYCGAGLASEVRQGKA